MKDYSNTLLNIKEHILNYDIVDNEIVIKYSNGEIESIPYSKEEETHILELMEKTLKEDASTRPLPIISKILGILNVILTPICAFSILTTSGLGIVIMSLATILNGILGTLFIKKTVDIYQKKEELKKMKYFMINKSFLNKNKEETTLKISDSLENSLNVNNIDSFSIEELQMVLEYIRENTLSDSYQKKSQKELKAEFKLWNRCFNLGERYKILGGVVSPTVFDVVAKQKSKGKKFD